MPKTPPDGYTTVTPYLYYEDVAAAMDWLARAFGFQEKMRMAGPDGAIMHAEMTIGDNGVIMLGTPGPDYKNPKNAGHQSHGLYVYVPDVDEHFARAKAAGANITAEPEDQFYGDRRYTAEDPEGHGWFFATNIRDFDEASMQPE